RVGVLRNASRRFARYSGVGRPSRKYASRSSSGIGSARFGLISWRMSSFGNNGSKAWGGTGSFVPGWRYGGNGAGRSGRMLYHARGRSSTSRRIFTSLAVAGSVRIACIGSTDPGSGFFEQYITILFSDVHFYTLNDGNINPYATLPYIRPRRCGCASVTI